VLGNDRKLQVNGAKLGFRFGAVAASALALATAGCSDASGQIVGGQPILINVPSEASVDLLPADCKDGGTHAGSGWNDLYTCYFGPTGIANCAGAGAGAGCHSSMDESGGAFSHFVCPPDGDAGTCYAGITPSIVPTGGATDPTSTKLYKVLRMPDNSCTDPVACMPLTPADLVFIPRDVDRINAWIQGGAPNN
jgi:hypothetical protein